ncbi:MAG: hypothetical protein KKC03_13495 [Bacteroidetes bacterium]|nr:hypothetical protein [Bacteroidota bacterium]
MGAIDFTAKTVMEKMDNTERYAFIAGVVEGLAYARYLNGDKDAEGMKCVYDWFYEGDKTIERIYAAFGEFGDYPPAAVVNALTKKVCGD